jgi:hypothetical protein
MFGLRAWLDRGQGHRNLARSPTSASGIAVDHGFEPDFEIRRLVDATRDAQEAFAARRKRRRVMAAAWLGLAMVGLSASRLRAEFSGLRRQGRACHNRPL